MDILLVIIGILFGGVIAFLIFSIFFDKDNFSGFMPALMNFSFCKLFKINIFAILSFFNAFNWTLLKIFINNVCI